MTFEQPNSETVGPIEHAYAASTPAPTPKGRGLRALTKRAAPPVEHDDPFDELRRLVKQHITTSRTAVGIGHMHRDRTNLETKETIPCRLPQAVRDDLKETEKRVRAGDAQLQSAMARQLGQIPIYTKWLRGVFGCGPVLAGMLLAEIRIDIKERLGTGSTKPSAIACFCGVAPSKNTGKQMRRTKGEKNAYHAGLKSAIFVGMGAMWKNAAKFTVCAEHAEIKAATPKAERKTAKWRDAFREATLPCAACNKTERPFGVTTKYLDVWRDAKFSLLSSPDFDAVANTIVRTNVVTGERELRKGARGWIHKACMWKAAGVFLEDLYVAWRAIDGLPVWPDLYDMRRGFRHGGVKLLGSGPQSMTFEEAVDLIGDVGPRSLRTPVAAIEAADDIDEEDDEATGEAA